MPEGRITLADIVGSRDFLESAVYLLRRSLDLGREHAFFVYGKGEAEYSFSKVFVGNNGGLDVKVLLAAHKEYEGEGNQTLIFYHTHPVSIVPSCVDLDFFTYLRSSNGLVSMIKYSQEEKAGTGAKKPEKWGITPVGIIAKKTFGPSAVDLLFYQIKSDDVFDRSHLRKYKRFVAKHGYGAVFEQESGKNPRFPNYFRMVRVVIRNGVLVSDGLDDLERLKEFEL